MPAVPTGSFRIAEQIGSWAVFADITLSAMVRADGWPLVTLGQNVEVDADGRDLAGISFGAAYALGYVGDSEGVGIIVHKLHTNPVDTTPMALAFATCHAVFECLKVCPKTGPYFDRSARSFVFPGRGMLST